MTKLERLNWDRRYLASCLESPVQGKGVKRAILIMSNGSEVGAFNDHGSVYAHDVKEVKREGSLAAGN